MIIQIFKIIQIINFKYHILYMSNQIILYDKLKRNE